MNMVDPSLDKLVTKVDSKYTLVVLAAKRARQLLDGDTFLASNRSNKNVTNALKEVDVDEITYARTKSGVK